MDAAGGAAGAQTNGERGQRRRRRRSRARACRPLAQADCVLLVADTCTHHPDPSACERVLLAGDGSCVTDALKRRELVLLHPSWCAQPLASRSWLRQRAISGHHHVRFHPPPAQGAAATDSDSEADAMASPAPPAPSALAPFPPPPSPVADASMGAAPPIAAHAAPWECTPSAFPMPDVARVARFMAGCAVGVVLGGGGSKGLAHIGALRVLCERGVPVDCVAGTSQGAFVAASYALTLSAQRAAALCRCLLVMGDLWFLARNVTLPLVSLFSGARLNRLIRDEAFGGQAHIEDTWLRFCCVSTNVRALPVPPAAAAAAAVTDGARGRLQVSRADQTVHETGPLWRYVRASMTIVGLLPPMQDPVTGDLLVDGGCGPQLRARWRSPVLTPCRRCPRARSYVNNLPVGVLKRVMQVRLVLAIDVENKDKSLITNVSDYGDSLSVPTRASTRTRRCSLTPVRAPAGLVRAVALVHGHAAPGSPSTHPAHV